MGWENGRRLTYVSTDDGQWRAQIYYTYDANGIRDTKDIDGQTHTYITQNGKVVRETIDSGSGTKVLDFIYDESGNPFALKYSPDGGSSFTTYYYILNLQGDVVMLIDENGNTAAKYSYNAWGNIISISGEMAYINPLRYRGYYYDNETGFYYLQSRYYDPAMHRFINADSLASTGQGFLGYNMFAYCNNSPVSSIDPNGNIAGGFCTKVINDGGGGCVSRRNDYINDQNAEGVGNIRLGLSKISHGGCGVVASYNALLMMGKPASIKDIADDYEHSDRLILEGFLGISPFGVANWFEDKGYTVCTVAFTIENYNNVQGFSACADASILWYAYKGNTSLGAHFVAYQPVEETYAFYNVSESYSAYYADDPFSYGTKGGRFFAIGIYIFEP